MIQTFLISGMTCLSCKANVEHTLNNFDDVNEASVDFDKKELTVNSNKDIDLTIFNKLLSPKYTISIENQKDKLKSTELIEDQEKSKLHQLKPLLLILLYITTASILLHFKNWSWNEFMLDFMGLFFIIFIPCTKSPEASFTATNFSLVFAKRIMVSALIFEEVRLGTL